jgi:invasion protein IalB
MTRNLRLLPLAFATALTCGLAVSGTVWAQAEDATEQADEAPTAKPEPARRAPVRPAPAPTARPPASRPPARPAQPVAQAQPTQQAPAAVTVGQPAASTATLPNGASAINESYGDWTVDCRITDGRKACVLAQSQGNSQTNQRVFAIELRTPQDGRSEGTILMPFGLKLDNGAVLRLDDKDLGQGLRFSTCVPQGCLLPISFPTVATDAMKSGKTLTAAARNLSNGDPILFNISLAGFSAALARITQLGS